MSSSKVRKWVRAFKDGWENVHDEPRSGRPSVITDDLVNVVDEKICEDQRFTISTSALEFPNVGRTTLHKVVSEKLKFRKLCARWVPRLLTEEHKLKRMVCALDFFWIDIIKKVINFREDCHRGRDMGFSHNPRV
ncbi:uncharacterized protein TNCV_3699561 [Trichonephila clavipes]|uniref:Transposase n=1 Tax=Trichonephila clavipes TaxID=2585209 RepID=A0A8X6VKZ7_TRICX|nr:uncharacterized protein TNCV_3699561 [Trichonephila clavipes]